MPIARLFRLSVTLAVIAALPALFAACSNTPTSPSNYAAFSQTDLQVGEGADAVSGSVVTVNYTGWFYDSSKTDQKGVQFTTTTGDAPFTFTVGGGTVIKGWDQGVAGMKVGGLRRLVIPPSLAYGDTRHASIPPNSTLVFEIELVSVE